MIAQGVLYTIALWAVAAEAAPFAPEQKVFSGVQPIANQLNPLKRESMPLFRSMV